MIFIKRIKYKNIIPKFERIKKNYTRQLIHLAIVILLFIANLNIINQNQSNNYKAKCYIPIDEPKIKLIHIIITRFMIEFLSDFKNKIYNENYIKNGIRVMKKYLFKALENQSCKDFYFIIRLGNKANITYIRSLLNLNLSFKFEVIYDKDIKNFIRNMTKGYDVLITTRIDYDDIIYYDAVNDVRKAININKPMLVYGYNRGSFYFESNRKFYDFYNSFGNKGAMSVFESLIVVLNQVNDTYNIHDMGNHPVVRKNIMENYKSYGIKKLNYDPGIFDSGDPKFVWVRQKFSGLYNDSINRRSYLIEKPFSLSKFSSN